MQLSDGTVIDESIDIMKWAMAQSSAEWFHSNIKVQDEMILHNDTTFKQWLDKYKYHNRHPENTLDFYRDKCVEILSDYEILLSKNLCLLGDKIQLVDAAIFPFVRQCANVDRQWFSSTFPSVERWLESWIQSKLFVRVMPKFEAWKLDDDPLYISF